MRSPPVPSRSAADSKIAVVAAENFYGDIARQIGGDRVAVVSIMNNPDQDPHLFETTPGIVRQIAGAQIAIVNGADYDPWMEKLLAAAPQPEPQGHRSPPTCVHKKAGDNPHLWYDPATMPAVAKAIAAALSAADAAHGNDYAARLTAFLASLKPLDAKIAAIRGKYAGAAVTASEPVFGYMAQALGLKMRNEPFQLSVMNDTEPSARDVAAFERDLKDHKVRVMFYQQAGVQQDRAASGRTGARRQYPGGRRDRNRAARFLSRTGCWASSTTPKKRWRVRLHECRRTRPRHHRHRRPQRSVRCQLRHPSRANSSACSGRTAPARPR